MSFKSFLIKPASSACNLRCRYCFYENESLNRTNKSLGVMSEDTADLLIKRVFEEASEKDVVSFAFQGGEPTLAGPAFFRHFVEEVARRNRFSLPVSFSLQTNGLLIDEEWGSFLKENNFLVGISIDGTCMIHDAYRVDGMGGGSYDRAVSAFRHLADKGVDVNVLTVVTSDAAGNAAGIYENLKGIDASFIQFIACLDPIEKKRGSMPYSLTPDAYGKFLCDLYDLWCEDIKKEKYISIRFFDDYVRALNGMPPGSCASSGRCGQYLVIEADGSAYPCDFYALDDYRLGNIKDMSIKDLLGSDAEKKFLAESLKRPEECASCKWQKLCRGGCRRDFYYDGEALRNYYCASFKMFYEHALGC